MREKRSFLIREIEEETVHMQSCNTWEYLKEHSDVSCLPTRRATSVPIFAL